MADLVSQTLAAGAVLSVNRGAGLFLLNEASAPIQVRIYRLGAVVFEVTSIGRGLKVRPASGFDRVDLINNTAGAVDVEAFISDAEVDVQIATGLTVTVDNGVSNPVPVDVQGATLTVSNVLIDQKPATVAGASYLVTALGVNVSTAAATGRRAIHFRNADAALDCYLAAFAAGTKAACPIKLGPGEMLLVDDRTASAQWKAFSDGADLTLVVQEVAE